MERKIFSDDEFRKLWDQGMPLREMADLYGCSLGYVSSKAHRLNLRRRQKRPDKFEEKKFEFRKLWLAGVRVDEISEALGIGDHAIANWRRRLDLEPRTRGWRRPEEQEEQSESLPDLPDDVDGIDRDLLETGGKWRALSEVADRHGLTITQAQQRFHKARAAHG